VAKRSRRSDSDVLPAITLEVGLDASGLSQMSTQLEEFADHNDLGEPVAERLVSVARDVVEAVLRAVPAPAGGSLTADADIGWDDAQLVVIAADPRLPDVYASLRPTLDRAAARCDEFAEELGRDARLQVWGRFRLDQRR
jgi:hypothetical protein